MSEVWLQLTEDIEEDIPEEIDIFVRLSRLGNFKKGTEWFEGSLSSQASYFPVLAERADFLLEQGSYQQLHNLLEEVAQKSKETLYVFTEDEGLLFRLFKAVAKMHIHGDLNDALEEARIVWRRLPRSEPTPSDEVEIHILEIYLRIIVFASQASSWVRPEDTQPPWMATSTPSWSGFQTWSLLLKKHGRVWEAQKAMRLLLTVLPPQDGLKLCEDFMENMDVKDQPESALITELSTANACTRFLIQQNIPVEKSEVLSKVQAWNSVAHSYQESLQESDIAEPKGRPYFETKLADLELEMYQAPGAKSPTPQAYRSIIQESREVADLRVQVESAWALYDVERTTKTPEVDEIHKLRALQVDIMKDSLGYVSHLNRVVQAYLDQHGADAGQAPIAEKMLESSPAVDKSFNAPHLKRGHLNNHLRTVELEGDFARISQAKKELQEYSDPPENRARRTLLPLHSAAQSNNIYAVRQALAAGDSVNERAEDGSTALHYAVERSKSLSITTLLLEHGARTDMCRDSDGYTPLHVLVSTSYRLEHLAYPILEKLLEYKADFRSRANDNGTVLGLAAQQNLARVVQRLLDAGADVHSPHWENRSALNVASWFAHVETMKVLIQAHANVNYNEWTMQTPLLEIVCNNKGNPHGGPARYVEGLELLLDNGADMDARTGGEEGYYTVLGRAVFNGNLGMVKVLIERGANPLTQRPRVNGSLKSLIDIAVESGHIETLRYLQGLDVRWT